MENRKLLNEVRRLIKPLIDKSFFLLGPRGTGKTTWLRQTYPGSPFIDLLADETYNRLLSHPQDLLSLIRRSDLDQPIIIDEVQKLPRLLDEVHRLIESKKLVFILTGSSARKLKRGAANLLAGRALHYECFPLTAAELGAHFDLKRALQWGTLPALMHESDPKAYLESYVRLYLKEEVQQEGLTRNIGAFRRFLEIASYSQAQPLVVTNVARDAQVDRKVVEDYFLILEDLLLSTRLPVFSRRAKRELVTKTKFFFFDAGVFQILRPRGPLDSTFELSGPALETLVLNEIRALNSYLSLGYGLYYWRTKSKHEVDLVLYGEHGLRAFEMKSTSRLRAEDFAGLRLFQQDYPMAQCTLIYTGDHKYTENNISVVPADEFFRNPLRFLK